MEGALELGFAPRMTGRAFFNRPSGNEVSLVRLPPAFKPPGGGGCIAVQGAGFVRSLMAAWIVLWPVPVREEPRLFRFHLQDSHLTQIHKGADKSLQRTFPPIQTEDRLPKG